MNFFNHKPSLFDFFNKLIDGIYQAAQCLETLEENLFRLESILDEVTRLEGACDSIVGQIKKKAKSWTLPFDGRRATDLAEHLDDIIDHLKSFLYILKGGKIESLKERPAISSLIKLIVQAVGFLQTAIKENLPGFKNMQDITDSIHELEQEGDKIHNQFQSDLFDVPEAMSEEESNKKAIEIVKWRDVIKKLEQALDRTKHAGKILERIILENS